jgi:hypothetical protein
MCFQFYEGKGYSADFTDHMGRVIKEFEVEPEQERLSKKTFPGWKYVAPDAYKMGGKGTAEFVFQAIKIYCGK